MADNQHAQLPPLRQQCVSTRARVHSNAKRHALKPRLRSSKCPCRLVVSVALWTRQPRFDSRCGQRCVRCAFLGAGAGE